MDGNSTTHPLAPFVVGVARSGTTLLRMMLDAHPDLAIPPETHFVGDVLRVFRHQREPLVPATEALLDSPRWDDFGLPAAELQRRIEESQPRAAGEFLRLFYGLYAEQAGKPRWGDKTPRYLDLMGPIQETLPEVRFVHVVRDGRDVALSVVPLWWGPSDTSEVAEWWASRVRAARRLAPRLSGYREVRYEDLVADPAGTLRSLCPLLDLAWTPSMLDYHHGARERIRREARDVRGGDGCLIEGSRRAAIHERVGEPPTDARVGRWRREMPHAAVREFERLAGDTLEACGYELSASGA